VTAVLTGKEHARLASTLPGPSLRESRGRRAYRAGSDSPFPHGTRISRTASAQLRCAETAHLTYDRFRDLDELGRDDSFGDGATPDRLDGVTASVRKRSRKR
jgi:hypothetical protein